MTKNLKQRVLTALVGAPVILGLVFGFGVEGVLLFAFVISSGMWFEYGKMFFKSSDRNEKIALMLMLNALVFLTYLWTTVGLHPEILGLVPVFLLSLIALFQVPRVLHYRGAEIVNTTEGVQSLDQHVAELMASCFGFVYCTWFPLLMVQLRQVPNGMHWVAFTLLLVWSADTFAYFAGSRFGKTPLFASVSPKKSWEGVAGGIFGAILVTQIYAHFFMADVSTLSLIVITLTASFASVAGDLFESLLKRATDCKDSGSILPGHGGFLDRFDGVVFALPTMVLLHHCFS